MLALLPTCGYTECAPAASAADAVAAVAARQQNRSARAAESRLYGLMREIVRASVPDATGRSVCTLYRNYIELRTAIRTCLPEERRERFDAEGTFESPELSVKYADEGVEDGFARLELTFRQNGKQTGHTIVCRPPSA